jgi:transcriptional regulator of arginine metabolism
MKNARQVIILELIKEFDIDTQEELSHRLKERGYAATQATVSRDIKELRLIKTLSKDGVYKYDAPKGLDTGLQIQFMRIFSHSVTSIQRSGNLIILHTLSGSANAACEAVDALNTPEILGSIAGDNTIFIACAQDADMDHIMETLSGMMRR